MPQKNTIPQIQIEAYHKTKKWYAPKKSKGVGRGGGGRCTRLELKIDHVGLLNTRGLLPNFPGLDVLALRLLLEHVDVV